MEIAAAPTPCRMSPTAPRRPPFRSASSRAPYKLALIRLGAGNLDHLRPFGGLLHDELAEFSRRAGNHRGAELGEPRLHLGIGDDRVGLPVEALDHVGGCGARRAEAVPLARL